MIKRVYPFLIGIVVGAVGMYVALIYHVVRAPDGFHLIEKTTATLSGCYADIREFKLEDWKANPDLAVAISASGKTHLLTENAIGNVQDAGQRIWDDLQR
ncbi:hypothetical protein ACFL2H_01360 [Planctomycetota bacterium]